MEALNLHLTGDFHAVTAAHNLLTAMVDNHLHHGNELGIDPRSIAWRRVLDVNDRVLRNIVVGLGARLDGVPRQAGFDITAASEVMVILALSTSLRDMRERLGRIVVGYTFDGAPVTAEDLKAAGAMTVILREAVKPNLLQTLENTPALVHTGPFGNIATGNSSVVADLLGHPRRASSCITEAGFGADMGAERFFDVKCRVSGLRPDAAVLVVTVRALKAHSGRLQGRGRQAAAARDARGEPRRRPRGRGQPAPAHRDRAPVRCLARWSPSTPFPATTTPSTTPSARSREEAGARVAVTRHVADGGTGALDLVAAGRRGGPRARPRSGTSTSWTSPWSRRSRRSPARSTAPTGSTSARRWPPGCAGSRCWATATFPVVIAKTHLSLSSDPTLFGAPTGWRMPVREVRAAAGAGYVYAISGDMRTMPGLGKHPAAERIDIDDDGNDRRPLLTGGRGRPALGQPNPLSVSTAANRLPRS